MSLPLGLWNLNSFGRGTVFFKRFNALHLLLKKQHIVIMIAHFKTLLHFADHNKHGIEGGRSNTLRRCARVFGFERYFYRLLCVND